MALKGRRHEMPKSLAHDIIATWVTKSERLLGRRNAVARMSRAFTVSPSRSEMPATIT